MVLMIIVALAVVGLCLGSFVNALVWRLHEQSESKKTELSIIKGRSVCPNCRHGLAAKDLVPVLSWLSLGGKCRYCGKPISAQYPLVELGLAALFLASYIWWPDAFDTAQILIFGLWLALLTGLIALLVYDLRWFLLPNKLIYPLGAIALAQALIKVATAAKPLVVLANIALAVIVGGGIFYLVFQTSKGKWIGGGDVKLGWLLGLVVGTPAAAALFIFIGSVLGSLTSLPLLATGRLKRTSLVPFGPFLIAGAIVTVLFGANILDWYQQTFIKLH